MMKLLDERSGGEAGSAFVLALVVIAVVLILTFWIPRLLGIPA